MATLRIAAAICALLLAAGCAHRPTPRVVFTSNKGIAIQSHPEGAVHYYEYPSRRKH